MSWFAASILASLCAPISGRSAVDEPYAGRKLVVMIEEKGFESYPQLEKIARAFEASHPGLTVQVMPQSGAVGQQDKSRFMLTGNLQLDVTRIDVTEFGAFFQEGALIDIDADLRAVSGWSESNYLPVLDGFRAANGHLYGLPSTFTPYVMYVNRDLLEKAGLAMPRDDWTWDDLLAMCRATTRDTDGDGRVDQWGISLTQWLQALVPWIWQNGGELLDDSLEHSRMAEPEVIDAIGFLRKLLHEEKLASFDASFENQFSQGLFQSGRCAFYGPVGYWETYRFKYIKDFRWDVVPLPRKKRAATAIAMTGYVVPRTSREPKLAAEFITKLAGPEYQYTLAEIGNGVPALKEAAYSKSFLSPDRPPDSEHVFLDVLPNARFMPSLANWRKIESICQAELQGVLLLEKYDAQEACRRMAQKTDQFLALEKERISRKPMPRWTLELVFTVSIVAACAAWIAHRSRARDRFRPREERAGMSMIGLWGIGFLVFFLGPAAVSLALSFCEWSPLRSIDDVRFVGLENYARLFGDDTFRSSFVATASYAILSVPLSLALALSLAWLLREESSLAVFLRTIVYIPAIISPVIVAAVWRFVLDPERGLVNQALAVIGVGGPAWTRDAVWVIPSFVLMSLWSVGAQMLVFLAAIKALDVDLEDAARVDGAGAWTRFRHVVLPQLGPVMLFNLVLGVVNAFQIFAQAYVLTGGGPGDASRFLVLYLYESGFRHLDMGFASAIAWVLIALLGAVCWALVRSSKNWVHYAARSRG